MSESTSQELEVGTMLHGRYRILKHLDQGGFGITYKANDERLGRMVCIKELFMSGYCVRINGNKVKTQGLKALNFEDFRKRFIREAQRLARFNNPAIVQVMDVFEENDTAYYCMDFIEGENLSKSLNPSKCMTPEDALDLFIPLLRAVEVLHASEPCVLHRDIKPSNVMLRNGMPILIDFGSTREYNNEASRLQSQIYTPGYAPPELYSEWAKDGPFSDVYSLGATLYFMLTGNRPMDAIERFTKALPGPETLNSGITEEMSAAILKAMAIKVEERFQDVRSFREELQRIGKIKPANKDVQVDYYLTVFEAIKKKTALLLDVTVSMNHADEHIENLRLTLEEVQEKLPSNHPQRSVLEAKLIGALYRQSCTVADLYYTNGNLNKAMSFYTTALKWNPLCPHCIMRLGEDRGNQEAQNLRMDTRTIWHNEQKQETIQGCDEILDAISRNFIPKTVGKLYVRGNIHLKKWQNFTAQLAHLGWKKQADFRLDDCLLYYDDTFWGKGDNGFVFHDRWFICKNYLEDIAAIPIKNVKGFVTKSRNKFIVSTTNGDVVVDCYMLTEMADLLEYLNALLSAVKLEK